MDANDPMVSVVTVCFNAAATIGDALASVATQTYPHVQHIVVDGGSRDATMVIVGQFPHVASAVSEPDRGIYDAMNKGLARADGEIVCFLNADDKYAHPDALARAARLMADDGLDAVFGDVEFFRAEGPERVIRRYSSHKFSPATIADGWMPAHPALFMRRAVFEAVGPFKTDYRIAGDFEFIARAFGPGELRYRYVPEVFVRMRTGGVSTSGLRGTILLNREVLRACRENGIETNWLRILSKYPAKLIELWRR
jgi:glycosyltransferase involved in cell wall biosynthesis